MNNAKRDSITALFAQFAGQEGSLVIPRPYIDFCHGDHLAALLLSQILYWSDRTDDPEGWFAKSYEDWHKELCMTDYQVKRAISGDKRRQNGGFCLKDIGVETQLKQSKFYSGAATLHYRINPDKLRDSVRAFLDSDNVRNERKPVFDNVQIPIPTKSKTGSLQSRKRSTETTTKNTSKTIKDSADLPVGSPQPGEEKQSPVVVVEEKPVQPHIAIIDAWYDGMSAVIPPALRLYERNVRTARRMQKVPYTPEQVKACTQAKSADPFWEGKQIPLETIMKDLPLWIEKQNRGSTHDHTNSRARRAPRYTGGTGPDEGRNEQSEKEARIAAKVAFIQAAQDTRRPVAERDRPPAPGAGDRPGQPGERRPEPL
jgi:hypothetical protein